MKADILAVMAATARDGAVPRVHLNFFEREAAERMMTFEPNDDALDPKRDAFATALADSPAWGAYFAAVGATFDHGAARARRHPKRVQ